MSPSIFGGRSAVSVRGQLPYTPGVHGSSVMRRCVDPKGVRMTGTTPLHVPAVEQSMGLAGGGAAEPSDAKPHPGRARAVPVMMLLWIVEEKGSGGTGPTREKVSVAEGSLGSSTRAEFQEIFVFVLCVIVKSFAPHP